MLKESKFNKAMLVILAVALGVCAMKMAKIQTDYETYVREHENQSK